MEVGRVLGPYTLERKLGAGGMGEVWAARHERIGRLYAVKVLLPELATRREALTRFEREARALSALGHPNIVQVHDFAIEPDGTAYLAMDLLDGMELTSAIAGRGLAPARARRIAMDIAAGLGAAHRIGLVHRDLKPSNVFLVGSGERERAVLLDFGLAKARTDDPSSDPVLGQKLTASGMILGTPHYMSPEQAQGLPLDARVDVWALGAVIYEMLSGRAAFEGPTIASVFAAILTRDPAPLNVPGADALEALAMRCLDKDHERRPADGNAVLATLEGELAAPIVHDSGAVAPTVAVSSTPATRAAISVPTPLPAPSPSPRAWLAGAAIMLAALSVGAWALLGRGTSPVIVESTTHVALATPDAGMPDAFVSIDAATPIPDVGVDAATPPIVRTRHVRPAAPAPSSLEGRVPPGMESAPGARELMEAGDRMNEGDWRGCLEALRHAPETAHILSVRLSCASNAHDRTELEHVCARLHERFASSPFNQTCETLLSLPR